MSGPGVSPEARPRVAPVEKKASASCMGKRLLPAGAWRPANKIPAGRARFAHGKPASLRLRFRLAVPSRSPASVLNRPWE
ncbi:hypothetical protein JCM15519_14490 [Fundidesulfovibrio butyratiphilus]